MGMFVMCTPDVPEPPISVNPDTQPAICCEPHDVNSLVKVVKGQRNSIDDKRSALTSWEYYREIRLT